MGRPGLALGTAGKIRVHATPSGHRAVAWYRDYDGKCRQVERHAKTKAAAQAALRLALRDRARLNVDGDITPDTRVDVLAEAWFTGLENLSPTTLQAYRKRLDQQILPGLGNLRVRELSVGTGAAPAPRLRQARPGHGEDDEERPERHLRISRSS